MLLWKIPEIPEIVAFVRITSRVEWICEFHVRSYCLLLYNEWRRCDRNYCRPCAHTAPVVGLLWLISCRCEKGLVTIFTQRSEVAAAFRPCIFKARRCVTAIDHFVVRRDTYLTVVKCTRHYSLLPWKNNAPNLFARPGIPIFPPADRNIRSQLAAQFAIVIPRAVWRRAVLWQI